MPLDECVPRPLAQSFGRHGELARALRNSWAAGAQAALDDWLHVRGDTPVRCSGQSAGRLHVLYTRRAVDWLGPALR